MNCCAIIATHHKTGTVWMRTIFRGIADHIGIPFANMKKRDVRDISSLKIPAILFNDHSHFENAAWMLNNSECRLMHIIRDPRDVLISAMNYHRTARERWLHKPQQDFRGETYQEALNSLSDDYARYLFEMENSAMRVINDMCSWNYEVPSCYECRYEALIDDVDMEIFTTALLHLGFTSQELDICLNQVWKNSLFGERAEKKTKHIRSGESRQWPKVFDRRLGEAFAEKFGDALIKLGYEPDDSWVSKLPD